MDARTVLSCLPEWRCSTPQTSGETGKAAGGDAGRAPRTDREIRAWLTRRRAEHEVSATPLPLARTEGWLRTPEAVTHRRGLYFDIVAVDVSSHRREVPAWSQPLLQPHGMGIAALFVKQVDGELHALLRSRAEPGFLDVVELGPTVQCVPRNYAHLPEPDHPPYLAEVLARRGEARYDVVLSEEGGRFRHAQSHYMIIETDGDFPAVSDEFRWVTPRQLDELLCYSHHVNVQARTLVAALRTL